MAVDWKMVDRAVTAVEAGAHSDMVLQMRDGALVLVIDLEEPGVVGMVLVEGGQKRLALARSRAYRAQKLLAQDAQDQVMSQAAILAQCLRNGLSRKEVSV